MDTWVTNAHVARGTPPATILVPYEVLKAYVSRARKDLTTLQSPVGPGPVLTEGGPPQHNSTYKLEYSIRNQ